MRGLNAGIVIMKIGLLASAIAFAAAGPALAANLVTNGDFGTGDFTGWTQFGNTGFTSVTAGVASFGPVGSTGGISQVLATAAAQTYHVSFDLSAGGGATNSASVDFGGNNLLSISNTGGFGTTHYAYTVTGTGSDTLSFTFQHDPDYYNLDNVAVSVPEAATWVMLIAGFGLVGAAARRRRALAA